MIICLNNILLKSGGLLAFVKLSIILFKWKQLVKIIFQTPWSRDTIAKGLNSPVRFTKC